MNSTRWKHVALASAIGVAVLALSAVAALIVWRKAMRPPPPDAAELRRQAQHAFTTTAPANAAPFHDEAGIRRTLDALAAAGPGGASLTAADVFDADRMVEEVLKHVDPGSGVRLSRSERRDFGQGLLQGMTERARTDSTFAGWTRYEIVRVIQQPADNEVAVYFRGRHRDGYNQKTCWWMCRRDGRWRIYDLQDLDGGMRVSALCATMLSQGNRAMSWVPGAQAIAQSLQKLLANELDEAEKLLRTADRAQFPPEIEALRCVAWASLHVRRGEANEALAMCDRAAAASPDMPVIEFLRAVANNQLGNHESALAAADRYASWLGTDADLAAERGYALQSLKRNAEAADAYRAGLDDDPNSAMNLVGLARVLPADQLWQQVVARFGRCTAPKDVFAVAAPEFDSRETVEALDALCQAYAPRAAGDPNFDYYRAMVKSYQGNARETMQILRDAIPRAPADEREAYVFAMLDASVEAGLPLEGYRAADDRAQAFRYIADELGGEDERDALAALLDEHANAAPDDPWLAFFRARQLELGGDKPAAEAAYAKLIGNSDDALAERARGSCVALRFHRGDILGAYRDIPPRDVTFDDLAWRCQFGERADDLEKLLAAHRAAGAKGKDLLWWDAQVRWLRKDYAGAINFAMPLLEMPEDEAPGWPDELILRALLRSNRRGEMQVFADSHRERLGSLLLILASAASGDPHRTAADIQAALDQGYALRAIYEDEDLGPLLLSSPALAPVRAKFPAPATQPQ